MVIRENEIFKRLKSVVEGALDKFGIRGIKVLQGGQPLPTNAHGCVIITRIGIKRSGWQGSRDNKNNGKEFIITYSYDYIDEATYQISGYVPRKASDSLSAATAYDIVSAVVTWLETPMGDKSMRDAGLQPLRITEIRTPTLVDDSNSSQFNPNFDLRFFIHQTVEMETPILMGAKPGGPGGKGTYPVPDLEETPETNPKYKRDGKGGIWHV